MGYLVVIFDERTPDLATTTTTTCRRDTSAYSRDFSFFFNSSTSLAFFWGQAPLLLATFFCSILVVRWSVFVCFYVQMTTTSAPSRRVPGFYEFLTDIYTCLAARTVHQGGGEGGMSFTGKGGEEEAIVEKFLVLVAV